MADPRYRERAALGVVGRVDAPSAGRLEPPWVPMGLKDLSRR
jgi:hypothetical protein